MKIERISMCNFKCFEAKTLELDPCFTLIAGDNGSGKTSILDALAIAAGIWLARLPDVMLVNSRRSILGKEIRVVANRAGDRVQFIQCKPVVIEAEGEICGRPVSWRRQIRLGGSRTTNADAQEAARIISDHYERIRGGEDAVSPVLAYYGAGRGWLPARQRGIRPGKGGPAGRWDAFYDCFEERIRIPDVMRWFQREAVASVSRGGWRPGYTAVQQAILRCMPDARDLWYDADRDEVVLLIAGESRPFSNLSAGQQMMLSMVADIGIKAVTQNAHLVSRSTGDGIPTVLQETPGMVLIDEIDVHLHPRWQRQVVGHLKETFPRIQFVCTSHSPFIIQSLRSGELRLLDPTEDDLDYADRPIEDIAEEVQGIAVPQRSARAVEFAAATKHYFELLRATSGAVSQEDLSRAEAEYRLAAERYSENPGLEAVLRLEALGRHDASN